MTRRRWAGAAAALCATTLALVWSIERGRTLNAPGEHLYLGAPPFLDHYVPHWGWWFVAIGIGALLGAVWLASERRSLRVSAVGAAALSAAWIVLLAATGGWDRLTGQISETDDFLPQLPWVRSHGWRAFFASFGDDATFSTFPTHVRSHPPGMVVLLGGLDGIGLGGPRWATAVVIGAAATIPLSVAIAVRAVTDDRMARLSAVLVVVTPAAVFMGTTPDALFAAVAAGAIALIAVAVQRSSMPLAVAAGVAAGMAVSFTYGTVPLVALAAAALCLHARRPLPLAGFAVGWLAVIGAWTLAGFDWFAGLGTVRHQYAVDLAQLSRPYSYFVIANLAVFACLVGPVVIASAGAVRRDGLWPLVAAALVAVLVADLSGLSKGEVERIWLPFVPWVTVAGAWLLSRVEHRWMWAMLAAQLTTGVVLQAVLVGIF